jgi:hypothetical protein
MIARLLVIAGISLYASSNNPIDLNDAAALDDKYAISANVACSDSADDYLRSAVKYDFKWDKIGFFEIKFDRYLTRVSSPGVLTVISNKVAVQNGFGAYEHIYLYCDYDTQAWKVLRYWIRE